MSQPNIEKIMKALAKYNIHNAEELNEAMKKMKPLDITCMVSPPRGDISKIKIEEVRKEVTEI